MNLDLYTAVKLLIFFTLSWIVFYLTASAYWFFKAFIDPACKIKRNLCLKAVLFGTVYILIIYVFSYIFGFFIFGTSYTKNIGGNNILCQGIWLENGCVGRQILLKNNVQSELACSKKSRNVDACAEILLPVCATVEIQCVKAPCEPIKQNYSNPCHACLNPLVKSYTVGECK